MARMKVKTAAQIQREFTQQAKKLERQAEKERNKAADSNKLAEHFDEQASTARKAAATLAS